MNVSDFKISVVIPCYNAKETIEKCIQSVEKQSMPVHEIVVVNDGSSDNSLELLHEIKSKCSLPITIIHQENAGPSVARNKAIKNANGNWIAFLDSDDFWADYKIEEQVSALISNPSVALIGAKEANDKKFSLVTLRALLRSNVFQTSATMVKTDVVNRFLFNEQQKYSEDYRTWLQIVANYPAGLVPQTLAFPVSGKASFGVSGLSSKLWKMEKGELGNFLFLRQQKIIPFKDFVFSSSLSMIKFLRRLIITRLR